MVPNVVSVAAYRRYANLTSDGRSNRRPSDQMLWADCRRPFNSVTLDVIRGLRDVLEDSCNPPSPDFGFHLNSLLNLGS